MGNLPGDMMRSSLRNGNLARMVLVKGPKQRGYLKMHIQLPDYDDFQGYGLGFCGILSRIAHKIYANFHKPSRKTPKHHWLMAETPVKLPNALKGVAENDKMTISNRKGRLSE